MQGFLFEVRMRRKKIYCPECFELLFEYDGKSEIENTRKCSNCKGYFVYKPKKDKVIKLDKPERCTASGTRFY